MATITTSNLIQGPGTLYSGAFASVEPINAAINTTPATSASWTDVGGTKDGTSINIAREFAELTVDQLVDTPERRMTKRDVTIETNLAEVTLENLANVANDTAPVAGSGIKVYEPSDSDFDPSPTYLAHIFDGYAPSGYRRRFIARKTLAVDDVNIAYKKEDQTVLTAKLTLHYVSSGTKMFKVVDQTA
jgi:hypothetical protein